MEKTKRAATGRDSEKYIVRFPDGMRNRIAEAAKANNRSMNAEIVARLERSLATQEMGFKADSLDIAAFLASALIYANDDRTPSDQKQAILDRAREISRPLMEGLVFSQNGSATTETESDE